MGIWPWASSSHWAAAPPLGPSGCHRGGPYVRSADTDRPAVTGSLSAGSLAHTPAIPAIGGAQRGHSECGPGERPCPGMGPHLQPHPGRPPTSPGYALQRPLPWPTGPPLHTAFFFFAGEAAVFLKGKCDHTILTQDPSLAPHRPQDKALKALQPLCPPAVPLRPGLISTCRLVSSSSPTPHPGPQTTEAGRGGPSRRPPHVATKATSSTTSVSPWERRPWLRTTALDYWWNF